MNLIQHFKQPFTMHSGASSQFKLECDALTQADCEAAAKWLLPAVGTFGSVEFVPSTGPVSQWLAEGFMPHVTKGAKTVLICDDVLTTGGSMEKQRAGRLAVGAVVFARGQSPSWIHFLLSLNPRCRSL